MSPSDQPSVRQRVAQRDRRANGPPAPRCPRKLQRCLWVGPVGVLSLSPRSCSAALWVGPVGVLSLSPRSCSAALWVGPVGVLSAALGLGAHWLKDSPQDRDPHMRFLLSQSVLFVPQASEPQPFRKRITLAWSAVTSNNVTSGRVTEGLHIADLNNDGPPTTSMNPVISDARSRDHRYIRGR